MYAELSKNEQGRYALPNGEYFTTDDDIEAFIQDQWIKTTVDHNHEDYYLVGYPGISLQGLMAKYPNVV